MEKEEQTKNKPKRSLPPKRKESLQEKDLIAEKVKINNFQLILIRTFAFIDCR